jgi:50S ribosomal protein L16 3-hydroxylase
MTPVTSISDSSASGESFYACANETTHDRGNPIIPGDMTHRNPPAGLDPVPFLKRYWQREPLLLRQAISGVGALLSPRELVRLACRDDAQARMVIQHGKRWELRHGPFRPKDFRALPERGWSLLVQEVNHFLPEAERLLRRFTFVPYARLDDLMVSYARDGGGVGPHFDSYDVFLLQGLGRRRWRISAQRDRKLVEDAPLRILRRFRPEQEWTLDAGDMLYLPPHYAHDGVALGECMTYSVGFRAPSFQELGIAFLDHLHDILGLEGMYEDRGVEPEREPARISPAMVAQAERVIGRIKWGRDDIRRFLGMFLTEPKPHVVFTSPRRHMARTAFVRRCAARGLALDLKTRMLYSGHTVFMNGDVFDIAGRAGLMLLKRLADERELPSCMPDTESAALLYRWYRDGYIAPVAEMA